jgi:hypothetical protein
MPQREFSLGDILSVTTPFCITSMDDMITVLEFMTGEERGSDMWTLYAIPRCAESLLQQHPQLAGITTPDEFTDLDHIDQWLADQEIVYGKTLTVSTLADTAAAAQ